jgi:hypothetical protein
VKPLRNTLGVLGPISTTPVIKGVVAVVNLEESQDTLVFILALVGSDL